MSATDKRDNILANSVDTVALKIGGVDKTSDINAISGKEATANKDATGGYVGLTLFKINFKNVANSIVSFFTNTNTVARTYTYQDRNGTIADDTDLTTTLNSAKAYADGLVVGLWDDRGNYDASGNTYPASGGSGTAGAILKGDIWTVSVAGVLNSKTVEAGDTIRALVDSPAQTNANWAVAETNIGYVPENSANKNVSGGYVGLSSLKIVMRNVADTFSSFFTNTNTASRTYTLQNRDGTIADDTDLALKVAKAGAETITGLKKFAVGGDNSDITIGEILDMYSMAGSCNMGFNAYAVAGVWKYKTTNTAILIQTNSTSGTYSIYTAPSGTINTNITWTLKYTIDLVGNVGFGGTPTTYANFKTLLLQGSANTQGGLIDLKTLDGSGFAQILQSDLGLIFSEISNLPIRFKTNNIEVLDITNTGVLDCLAGQIKFPATANPSSDVNTLDDYKEGTFTGGVAFAGVSTGITFSTNDCTFTKIGRRVFFDIFLIFSNKGSATGSARITGLPYTSGKAGACDIGYTDAITFSGETRAYVANGGTTLLLDNCSTAGSQSNLTDANFANNSQIQISGSYII